MRNNLAATTGAVALLALAAHTFIPAGGETRGGAVVGAAETKTASDSKAGENAMSGPWLATRPLLGTGSVREIPITQSELAELIRPLRSPAPMDAAAKKSLRELFGIPEPGSSPLDSYAVVATVADPVHTRLALFLDGQIDAIERGLGQ